MHVDQLLLQIAAVLVVGRVLARIVRWLGQPVVIAEIVAGIALGPSLLGLASPQAMNLLFPASSMDLLGTVAQLGLVFFMFLVGLEFDPRLLQGRARTAFAISGAGIVVPLASGVALAFFLPATLSRPGVPVLSFSLFVGVAMSVTAFPVLARILTERRLVRTPVGAMALAAAAVDDVSAWSLLALVAGIASATGPMRALGTIASALVYVALVWFVARPLLQRLGPRQGREVSVELMSIAVLLVVVSALITEVIGIHALFGGFLIGAAMPRGGGLSTALAEKMGDSITIVLLPLFFAYSGLRTEIGLVHTAEDWGLTLLLFAVASLGKLGGCALAARLTGFGARESLALGILMNTRGLMEIVVLNVGLDLGVISEQMFAMMILVAVATTWMTTPILRRVYAPDRDAPVAPLPAPSAPTGLMLCVADPQIAGPLVRLAAALRRPDEPVWVVHLRPIERPHEYLRDGGDASEPLAEVDRVAAACGLPYEPIVYSSAEPEADLVRIAAMKHARVVVVGTHRTTFGAESLGGVTGAVLDRCDATVGILLDRGLDRVARVGVDPSGAHGAAVDALAADLRARGAALVGGPADLKVRGYAPDAALPAHPDTSLLLIRGPRERR